MILVVVVAVAIGVRDARERIIPNRLVAVLAALGSVFQLLRAMGLVRLLPWGALVARSIPSPAACLACAGIVLAVGTALELAHRRRTGSEGMGFGDVKCLAAWALVEGPLSVVAFAVACLAGALWALAHHQRDFALGPWMCAACVAALVLLAFAPAAP